MGPAACAVLLLVLTGCLGARLGRFEVQGADGIPTEVSLARQRLRALDTAGALALLEEARPLSAEEPERSWLLAHLLRERSEGAVARARLSELPRGAFETALRASLSEDPDAALATLARAMHHRRSPWLDLARAHLHQVLGDANAAIVAAARARRSRVAFIRFEAHLVEARAHLAEGRFEKAIASAEAAARVAPEDIRATTVAAAAARRAGRPGKAASFRLRALRWVPGSAGQARALADLLRRSDDPELPGRIEEGLLAVDHVENAERDALEGLLAERRGDDDEAVVRYEAALDGGANPIPVERDLRGLLARRGAHRRVVALLEGSVPEDVRLDPGNLRRPAWEELARAVDEAPDREGSAASRQRLARALLGVGALREAREVLGAEPGPECRDLADRLDAHRAFVDAFEEALEGGYRRGDRHLDTPGLAEVLQTMKRLAEEHLPADEVEAFQDPGVGTRNVPLIGTWLDHSTDTSSPVVAYFRTYGTYLVLGR